MSQPLSAIPQLLAILNVSPESFSERGHATEGPEIASAVAQLVADGADVIDVGAQSLRTDQAVMPVSEEVRRVSAVLDVVVAAAGGRPVSVDTFRPEVVEFAVAHGATIINDPSGVADPAVLSACVASGADLVMTYNIAKPKVRLSPEDYVEHVVEDGRQYFQRRIDGFVAAGGDPARIILDPGIDLGKSPQQSLDIVRATDAMRAEFGGLRVLWALSRKDFIGSLLGRTPKQRDFGTLGIAAALPFGEGDLLRIHNVRGAADFFAARAAVLNPAVTVGELDVGLRYEP